jgi:hypothetical protein
VNWIHEPRLYTRTGQGISGIFTMATNDPNGPVRRVLVIGGNVESNIRSTCTASTRRTTGASPIA